MNKNLTSVILIVLAVGIYFTVTEGLIAEGKTVAATNKKYTDALESAAKLIKIRDQVLNDYKNLKQDDRDRLDKMIPKNVDNIRLVIDLNNVALKHGFTLKNIKATAQNDPATRARTTASPEETGIIPTPTLDHVTVGFAVTAPYQQFINFMQDLEANLRIMDVSSLSLKSADDGIYEWTVELKTYWLRSQ